MEFQNQLIDEGTLENEIIRDVVLSAFDVYLEEIHAIVPKQTAD
jgi:hypothetical protein